MLIDARQLPPDETLRCDVCVVGAGPAGIAVARELASRGKSVVLLESGGLRLEAASEDLNKGEVVDPVAHGPLEAYRRRRLGGATTAWGGRCVPFDAIDFERRSWVPNSGWPFGKSAVDAYGERAHAYLDLGAFTYDPAEALAPASRGRAMIPGLASDDVAEDTLYLFSPPTNFGKKFQDELAASRAVRLVLYASCLKIMTDREGSRATHLVVGSAADRRFSVVADRFVLAAGGLENVRLLLASNDVHPGGIGNRHDLLGRYYMCHVIGHLEVEFTSREVVWDYEKTASGLYCQRTVAVRAEAQRRLGLLNHRARIEHADISDPSHGSGVLSASYLVKSLLASPLFRARLDVLSRGVLNSKQKQELRVAEHLRNILLDAGGVARFSRRWIEERILSDVKLPSVVMRSDANVYTLRLDAEQIPNPDSRVTLGDARDALGQRRLKVDWRRTGADDEMLLAVCRHIGRALEESGAGRLRSDPSLIPEATGGHHIGTTRMSSDPSGGVVDGDCRVHDVKNLYIASSSVFPTCSYANPTLLVLSLALRLADHLEKVTAQTPSVRPEEIRPPLRAS
jgi:choline dehydrogenase-like flavoprotein